MKKKHLGLGIAAAIGGVALLLALTKSKPKPKPPAVNNSPVHSFVDSKNWTIFGNGSISDGRNGFTLTNKTGGGSTEFASAAVLLQDLFGGPFPLPVTLHLRIKGGNGAKKLGITMPRTDENPNFVSGLSFTRIVDISDGLEHDLVFTMPKPPFELGLSQLALHFGQDFGGNTLGNPGGATIQVLDVSLQGDAPAVSATSSAQSATFSSNDAGLVTSHSTQGISIVSPGSTGSLFVSGDAKPTRYIPLFSSSHIMDVSPLVTTQERLNGAKSASSSLMANRAAEYAASANHPVISR